jgi:hypothetical protein
MIRRFFLLLCFSAAFLSAHKLNLFLYDENGTLFIQSYFHKSAPCKNCEVTIEDENGGIISKLSTNDEGKAEINLLENVLSVSVDGGMGHFVKESYTLKNNADSQTALPPEDTTWYKSALGLFIMTGLFFVLWFVKRKK